MRIAQINIHPNDVRHIPTLLPHQLRVWAPQTDKVLVTLDLNRSKGGHYAAQSFEANLRNLRTTLDRLAGDWPTMDVDIVDPSPDTVAEVAEFFFKVPTIPQKAWNGSPLYAYLYGLWRARDGLVVHFDGDMLFGGGSETWLEEAATILENEQSLFAVAPLSGPPVAANGTAARHDLFWESARPKQEPRFGRAFSFAHLSTRIFVSDMTRLRGPDGVLRLTPRVSAKERLHATLLGNPPEVAELERVLSANAHLNGKRRLDFLGEGTGMWSLHPPFRGEGFYSALPSIVADVEANHIPEAQRGHYNIVDEWVDWTAERKRNSTMQRWSRHFRHVISRPWQNSRQ